MIDGVVDRCEVYKDTSVFSFRLYQFSDELIESVGLTCTEFTWLRLRLFKNEVSII